MKEKKKFEIQQTDQKLCSLFIVKNYNFIFFCNKLFFITNTFVIKELELNSDIMFDDVSCVIEYGVFIDYVFNFLFAAKLFGNTPQMVKINYLCSL